MYNHLCKGSLEDAKAVTQCTGSGTCVILQYHRTASLCFDPLQLAVEPYHFEEQIEYLAESLNVISIDDMKRHLDSSIPFGKRTVVITFDGGYSDILYTAKSVLESFAVPATVFATSVNILEGGRFWWQELEDLLLANQSGDKLELEIDRRLHRWPLSTHHDRCRAYDDLYSILLNTQPAEQKRLIEETIGSLETARRGVGLS